MKASEHFCLPSIYRSSQYRNKFVSKMLETKGGHKKVFFSGQTTKSEKKCGH